MKEVDARNTTQRCSRCGLIADIKKDLNVRTHECLSCDLKLDRDYNAALNILKMGQELALVERKPILVSTTNIKSVKTSKLLSMKHEAQVL